MTSPYPATVARDALVPFGPLAGLRIGELTDDTIAALIDTIPAEGEWFVRLLRTELLTRHSELLFQGHRPQSPAQPSLPCA